MTPKDYSLVDCKGLFAVGQSWGHSTSIEGAVVFPGALVTLEAHV